MIIPHKVVPRGWYKTADALEKELSDLMVSGNLDYRFQILKMVEHRGKLVIVTINSNLIADNIIKAFCEQAETTCADCSHPAGRKVRKDRWVKVLCPFCESRRGLDILE